MKIPAILAISTFCMISLPLVQASSTAAPPGTQVGAPAEVINLGEHADIHTDPTKAFTEAFNSGATKVIVPNLGQPYVVGPIVVRHGEKEIVMEPGVVIEAKPGAYKHTMASLIRLENLKNVTIRGNGATLRMNRTEYLQSDHRASEHRHGLSIGGSENILVEDLTIEETGGDGVYISGIGYSRAPYPDNAVEVSWQGRNGLVQQWAIPTSKNVTIRRVVADRNHRQGLSLISGENILIEDCVFKNTSGTAPMHGLDIEPALPYNELKNVVVRNCIAEMNEGAGFAVYLRKLRPNSEPVSILFENCEVRGGKGRGLVVGALGNNEDEGVPARIEFKNCTVENTEQAGIYVYDKSYKVGEIIFDNCTLTNVATSDAGGPSSPELATVKNERRVPPPAPIVFFLRRQSDLPNNFGGVVFNNCRVDDSNGNGRPVVAQGASAGPRDIQVSEVHGTITTLHKNPVMNVGQTPVNVTLELVAQ